MKKIKKLLQSQNNQSISYSSESDLMEELESVLNDEKIGPNECELHRLHDMLLPCFNGLRDINDVAAVFRSIHDLIRENPRVSPITQALRQFAEAADCLNFVVAHTENL